MLPARSLARAVPRAARSVRTTNVKQCRFQSNTTSSTASNSSNAQSSTSHFAAGVAGGVAGAALLYGIYLTTPSGRISSKINKAAREAQKEYQVAAQKLQEKTPNADQAIDHIKQFCYSYVAWVPGGRAYVDTAFKDLDTVRQNHGEEVERIINDAYRKLQDVSKSGLSMETLHRAYDVITDIGKQIGDLAGNAIGDILDNHPQLKEKVGGNIDQLKQMGEQLGPEAKKIVDDTWPQVKDIMASGFTVESANKVRQLIQEKQEQVKKLGDEAWKKGMEQAKPYLEKNPKIKELVEKNADKLKGGNATELFQQVKSAVESGNSSDLESYVNKAVEKAKSSGMGGMSGSFGSLDQFMGMLPQGSEIVPKLQHFGEIFKEHSKEGEQLLQETAAELKKVLEDKANKAQKIVEKARKEGKSS